LAIIRLSCCSRPWRNPV